MWIDVFWHTFGGLEQHNEYAEAEYQGFAMNALVALGECFN